MHTYTYCGLLVYSNIPCLARLSYKFKSSSHNSTISAAVPVSSVPRRFQRNYFDEANIRHYISHFMLFKQCLRQPLRHFQFSRFFFRLLISCFVKLIFWIVCRTIKFISNLLNTRSYAQDWDIFCKEN